MTNTKHGNFIEPETQDELEQLNVKCPLSREYYHFPSYDTTFSTRKSWDIACNCDVLPVGTYYIGDPCYAIGQSDTTNRDYWINFCNVIHRERKTSPTAKWNRKKIATARKRDDYYQNWGRTKSSDYGIMVTNPEDTSKKPKFYDISIFGTGGDGTYTDVKSDTGKYSVDAGLIGAVPIEAIPTKLLGKGTTNKYKTWKNEPYTINGGHIFTFEDDVHCYETNNHLIFGSKKMFIGIDTDPGRHEMEAEEAYYEAMEDSRPW